MGDGEQHQWYTNKELFERLGDLKDEFSNLRIEMKETRALIKSYNGLREEIEKMRQETDKMKEENDAIKTQVQVIISKDVGKTTALDGLRNWGGWIFALVTLLVVLYNQLI